MNTKDTRTIDSILRHHQLSHRDARDVEMFGNEAFDCIRTAFAIERP